MERGRSSESNDRGLLSTVVGGGGFLFDSEQEVHEITVRKK